VCRLTGSGSPAAQPPAAQHRRRSQPTADLWCQWLFRSMSDPHLPLHRLAPLKRLSQGSRREPAALRGSPRRRLGGGTRCLLQSEVQVDGAGPQRARGAVQRVERVNPISDTCAYRLGSQPLWASDRGSRYGTTKTKVSFRSAQPLRVPVAGSAIGMVDGRQKYDRTCVDKRTANRSRRLSTSGRRLWNFR